MSFSEAVATLPDGVRLWVLWLTVAMAVLPLTMLFYRRTRRDGAVALAASACVVASMYWLHAQVGFVRLLGLPHIVFWTPLAVYLGIRIRWPGLPGIPRVAMGVLLATITVSLVFDYVDVARWLAGDRAPMTPETSAVR